MNSEESLAQQEGSWVFASTQMSVKIQHSNNCLEYTNRVAANAKKTVFNTIHRPATDFARSQNIEAALDVVSVPRSLITKDKTERKPYTAHIYILLLLSSENIQRPAYQILQKSFQESSRTILKFALASSIKLEVS